MSEDLKPLAVVTGASSGIGYELAKLAVENGFDLVIAADRPEIAEAASAFQGMGAQVDYLQVDLAGPPHPPPQARPRPRTDPVHRLDRRPDARKLPGGLQRHQGLRGQLL